MNGQPKDLYAALGQFVVAFELLIHEIRSNLLRTVCEPGTMVNLVQPAYADLTADPLARIYLATMSQAIEQSKMAIEDKLEGKKILANIHTRIRNLITERNEIVHGTWFIGFDFDVTTGFKQTNTKDGTTYKNIERSIADFDAIISNSRELMTLVNQFHFVLKNGLPLAKHFGWLNSKVLIGVPWRQ